MTDVKAIVADYLVGNGFDGLYTEEECACRVGDLMPCDSACSHCEPGYFQDSRDEPNDTWDWGFKIGPYKPDNYDEIKESWDIAEGAKAEIGRTE